MTRVTVYCSACHHPGKARSADELGVCSRCGAPRVQGWPSTSTGRPVGRPRLTIVDRLRRLADEIEREELERAKAGKK